jgi:uncharacterized protein YdcH (DUF465 family)
MEFEDILNEDDGISADNEKKRKNRKNESSTESSPTNSSTTEQKKSRIMNNNKVAPIVIFDVDTRIKNNPVKLEQMIEKCKLSDAISRIGIDRRKQLLIYPIDEQAAQEILDNNDFFGSHKKINLGKIDNNIYLVIKGLPFSVAKEEFETLKEQGIAELIELKSKNSNEELPIVKVRLESVNDKKNIYNYGITLGRRVYRAAAIFDDPKQCSKCKGFNHATERCTKDLKCAKCGEDHDEKECTNASKCANCSQSHNAYYKGCSMFKEAKKVLALNNSSNARNETNPNAYTTKSNQFHRNSSNARNETNPNAYTTRSNQFHRNVSAMTSNDEKFDKLMNSLNFLTEQVTITNNKITTLSETVTTLQPQIDKINQKIPKALKETVETNNNNLIKFIAELIHDAKLITNVALLNKAADKLATKYSLGNIKLNNYD